MLLIEQRWVCVATKETVDGEILALRLKQEGQHPYLKTLEAAMVALRNHPVGRSILLIGQGDYTRIK